MRAVALLFVAASVALTGCGSDATPTASSAGDGGVQFGLPPGTEAQVLGPWSATPFSLPPAIVAKMDVACRTSMQPFPAGVSLVVVDARGTGAAQLYYAGANGANASCNDVHLSGNGTVEALGGGSTGMASAPFNALAPTGLVLTDQSGTGRPPNTTASYLAGRVGPGIKALFLVLANGKSARATLTNGWFAVWFPGDLGRGWFLRGLDATGAQAVQFSP